MDWQYVHFIRQKTSLYATDLHMLNLVVKMVELTTDFSWHLTLPSHWQKVHHKNNTTNYSVMEIKCKKKNTSLNQSIFLVGIPARNSINLRTIKILKFSSSDKFLMNRTERLSAKTEFRSRDKPSRQFGNSFCWRSRMSNIPHITTSGFGIGIELEISFLTQSGNNRKEEYLQLKLRWVRVFLYLMAFNGRRY